MSDQNNGADVAVKIAGQEVNLKNVKSLNTLATVATLIIVVLVGYIIFEHKIDARAHGESLTSVMKDMAQAIREGNCINAYPEAERESKVEQCKRLAR